MLLGDKIKQLRKNNHITQGELADKILVSRQTISNWENNKSYPSMEFIVLISEVFEVSIDSLIKKDVEITREELEIDEGSEQNIIQQNKERVILNRLLFFRLQFVWIGTFVTVYFYTSKSYLNYIWFPIFFIVLGLLMSIPINMIRKKYHLETANELKVFLDEMYK